MKRGDWKQYLDMHALLSGDDEHLSPQEKGWAIDEWYTHQCDPSFRELIGKMQHDPLLKDLLYSFTENAIEYANEEGEILDGIGRHNLIVVQDNDDWNIHMLDPLMPRPMMLDCTRVMLEQYAKNQPPVIRDLAVHANTFNFVRTINGLAMLLGIPDRIRLMPEALRGKRTWKDFDPLLKEMAMEFQPRPNDISRHSSGKQDAADVPFPHHTAA